MFPRFKLYFLDKYGYPIERIRGKWFSNFVRILIHTRRITRKRPSCLDPGPPIPGCDCQNIQQDKTV